MNDYKCYIIADSMKFEDVLKITKEKLQELTTEIEKYEFDLETNNDDISTINLSEALAKASVMIKQVVYLTECDDDYEEYIRFELNKQIEEINNKKKGVIK